MYRYCLIFAGVFFSLPALAQYPEWKHSGSFFLLTTPDGANLPARAELKDFPLLVRLHRDSFDFSQARADGADLRFSAAGAKLPYQIEEWDPAQGQASIWLRVPSIRGNARQELKLHWGKPEASAESSGAAVFGESNGYVSVWHLGATLQDEVGTLATRDVGTTTVRGVIGQARHLAGNQGLFGGDKIPDYPTGGAAHSTEAWFRAEKPNATILAWGNEGGGRGSKVRMQLRSPPHLHIDSDFSDVDSPERLSLGEWIHVVHTYENSCGRIYINGKPAGEAKPTLNIRSPARLWLGGWYDNYDFVGDLDEVRVSKVARSAEWVKLQYENQKPLQRAVGTLVRPGTAFSVSTDELTLAEGKSARITAEAGGAQRVEWVLQRDGRETLVAADRFQFDFPAGRVIGDQTAKLQFRAIYPDGVKSKTIAIRIREAIPEPEFTLPVPATWDGRQTLEIQPKFVNQPQMRAAGAGELTYRWRVEGIATIRDVQPGKLILSRAQTSGAMTITLAVSNGGAETLHTATVAVKEPASDPWVRRIPSKDERPVDHQFYARDDQNEGTLHCTGTLSEGADAVFLKLYGEGKLLTTERQKLDGGKAYALSANLKAGLIHYRVEFGTDLRGEETIRHTATDLVCGDVYLIDGQSNAEATDVGRDDPPFRNEWIRSFGRMGGDSPAAGAHEWAQAVVRDRRGGRSQIGYWGWELARRLVEAHKMPICILNGAVGGSRIDQHQRNAANPEDPATMYGRLLGRVRSARLTHGIRGILWHQGENDQGADGPSGGFGWETYRDHFIDLAAGWKRDYPNVQHFYVFQIWPRACSMGVNGSDNKLREVQRTLTRDFSKLSVMSTLGILPPGGCHFPPAGYAEFARRIAPLIDRDFYGFKPGVSITPPNLLRASYADAEKREIVLEFDQPVVWERELAGQFFVDGVAGRVESGRVVGNTLRLRLTAAGAGKTITYLDSRNWKETNLLKGVNGIAALTFCEVPLEGP